MQQIIFLKWFLAITILVTFSACGESGRSVEELGMLDNGENQDITYNITTKADKKIFLIGDSTVNNPTDIGMGWGDQIGQYMVNSENLFNLAQSGSSSKSYKDWKDDDWYNTWPKTKRVIESTDISDGGYMLIQFGHNDETDEASEADIKTYPGRGNSFYNELKEYVVYAKNVGLTPVLITPVERMEKVDGYLHYTHVKREGDYAQTVRDLSQDEDVLLLDLQDKSWKQFNTYRDREELISIFGYADNTHFNSYGADIVSTWVKELICNSDNQTLCAQFK